MAWQRNYVVLNTGERVRFAFLERDDADAYYIRFRGPKGNRLKKSTGQMKKVAAIDAAHRLILEEYGQVAPTSETVSWDVAKAKLTHAMDADGKRPKTIRGYLETLDKLTAMFPLAKGPADITDRMAGDFKTKYGKGTFTRKRKVKEGEATPRRARKAKSLDGRIRTLKAVFGWFQRLRLVNENPFEKVAPPELDRHEVKYVREADVGEFFGWLQQRYPGWRMPHLFFSVKAATACRLEDICRLRSRQLQDGRLVFTADMTKNRSERYALLPAEVYAELEAYKGKDYLWERYPPELIAANKAKGWPTHRQNPEFSPQRLYLWVLQLMQAYQAGTGKDLSSHDFRRAAFTRAAEEDVHPKRAAVAFDVTAETMMRYYTATEKKRTADEVLGDLAGRLLPKPVTRKNGEGEEE
jgi:site-specific recombinase XerD